MPHDAANSSLPTEPSAEPVLVESRAPAVRQIITDLDSS
jgi:hypothetical protein